MMARAEQQRKLMSNAKKVTSKAAPAILNQIADDESTDEAATMLEDQSQE